MKFRPPTEADMDALAANMREIDQDECRLVGGMEPREALGESVGHALWAYAAEIDGEVVCIFGLSQDGLLAEEAYPWMLAANGIERHARTLLRLTPIYLARMQGEAERLYNIVHAHNRRAIRYLTWCGFTFGEGFDVRGAPFLPFEMKKRAA